MSRADGILHLVLNAHPWDEIKAGRKPVEYRSLRWRERIAEGGYTKVRLQRGFHKVDGKVPTLLFRIDHIDIGPADSRWVYGIVPTGEDLVRIWLGELLTKPLHARTP